MCSFCERIETKNDYREKPFWEEIIALSKIMKFMDYGLNVTIHILVE